MYCDTNQFPPLPFCYPHPKTYVTRGFIKHYNLRFDPKLGNGICAILRVPFSCISCTSMLDQPCIYGLPSKKQARYQPVIYCT